MGPTTKDINELTRSCQGLVRSIAWKIHQKVRSHVEMDDLVGYGQVGLAEAVRDFDPDRGVQITTFAYYRIRGAILDGLTTMSWFNRADYSRGRYERIANELFSDSSSSGESLREDAQWFRQTTGSLAMVYLISQHGTDAPAPDIADSNQGTPDSQAEMSDLAVKLHRLIEELPEDAQTLVRGVYFEGLTIKEAGERFGVSKAWASRMHTRILEKLAYAFAEFN